MQKRHLLSLIFIVSIIGSFETFAQTIGDYRSNNGAAFNWDVDANWQRWDGAAWVVPTAAQGYPGETAASIAGTVTIQNGHTVRANVDVTTNDIGNLVLAGSGILNYNTNNVDIEATGNLTMDATSQIQGTSTNRTLRIAGAFNVPATATNARIENIRLTVIGTTTISGLLTLNTSNVIINTGNLTLQGTGRLDMNAATQDVNVTGALTMNNTSQITGGGTSRTLDAATFNVPATATNARITNIQLTIGTTPVPTPIPTTVTINGLLDMSSTTCFFYGGTNVAVGATLTLSSNTGVKTFSGRTTVDGTWTSTAITTNNNLVFIGEVVTSGTFNCGCN